MKTLYERLKPEHKDALADEATKWPAISGSIVNELENKSIVLDLNYGTVCCIANALNLKNTNIDTIVDLFEAY